MQDQTSPRDAAAELDQLERVVLHLLLDAGSPGILSEREVSQAIGSDVLQPTRSSSCTALVSSIASRSSCSRPDRPCGSGS
jgi:hypothetical protein